MLKRIVTKTDGDWVVVELGNGKRYRLSGMERVSHRGLVADALADAAGEAHLIDRGSGMTGTGGYPFIREFIPNGDGKTYQVRAENGEEFTVTAGALKTLLTA